MKDKTYGKVTKFNRFTYFGEVISEAGKTIRFHSTSFSSLVDSWPTIGMSVEIVHNKRGGLVAIHEVKEITCGYEPCDNGPCRYPKEHAEREARAQL